jgi:uncharacterized protein YndB with AHSA1/START domain
MSRKQIHEIEIEATPEDVWQHLTEADKIVRWFAPEVRVEPGLGGKLLLSWGPGMEGEAPIHLWEPGHRFGWTETGATPKVVEFEIEAREGGTTLLRLVQSGFGEGAKFDDEYEAVNGGWRTFFQILKFGMENHLGVPFTPVSTFRLLEMERDQITPRLSAALGISPALDQLKAGETYASNFEVRGIRLEPVKPGYYLLTASNWNNSLLALFTEKMGDKCYFTLQAYLFGEAASHAGELKTIFTEVQL